MNKTTLAACAASIALVAPAHAADAQTAITPKMQADAAALIAKAQASDLAYKITESLTTEIGPRLAGSDAEARARAWGVKEMKALGFKNVHVENFEIPRWERHGESAAIVAPFPQPLAVTALGGSIGTPDGGLTAPVVRFADLAALKAAPEGSLKGKIAFIDGTMTPTQDGSGYGDAGPRRWVGPAIAAGKGAVATVIRSVGTDNHRVPHTGQTGYGDAAAKIPAAALSNPDADQLARTISYARGDVTLHLDLDITTGGMAPSGNVVGEIPGRTDEVILLGAHLDSWDLGTGAIDDGAGIGVIAAAAKLVDEMPGKPKRTIRVVFFGSEESSPNGGKTYVEHHKDEIDRHVVTAESDFGADRIWRVEANVAPEKKPLVDAIAAALSPLGVIRGDGKAHGGADISDAVEAGVPVFDLNQDGMRYFDLHHTADDTFDKIDPEQLAQNVAVWAAFVWLSSEMNGDFRADAGTSAAQE